MTQDFTNLPFSDEPEPLPTPAPMVPPPPSRAGQRIAEASWISCGIAIILSLIIGALKLPNSPAVMALSYIALALMVLGLILSITAFAGMKRSGNSDITRPALSGLILSIALLALTARAMFASKKAVKDQQAFIERSRQEQLHEFEQAQRDAFLEAGWLGVQPVRSIIVTLTSMHSNAPPYSAVIENLGTDASLALLIAQNAGVEQGTVDLAGAVATLEDGSQVTVMDVLSLLKNAKYHREELLKTYSTPLMLTPSAGGTTLLFFPHNLDWQKVRTITLKVNGEPQIIPGRYYTRDEKRSLIRVASQPTSTAPRQ